MKVKSAQRQLVSVPREVLLELLARVEERREPLADGPTRRQTKRTNEAA